MSIFERISPIKTSRDVRFIYGENGEIDGAVIYKRVYICLPGRRLIFRNGKYEGWYRP